MKGLLTTCKIPHLLAQLLKESTFCPPPTSTILCPCNIATYTVQFHILLENDFWLSFVYISYISVSRFLKSSCYMCIWSILCIFLVQHTTLKIHPLEEETVTQVLIAMLLVTHFNNKSILFNSEPMQNYNEDDIKNTRIKAAVVYDKCFCIKSPCKTLRVTIAQWDEHSMRLPVYLLCAIMVEDLITYTGQCLYLGTGVPLQYIEHKFTS